MKQKYSTALFVFLACVITVNTANAQDTPPRTDMLSLALDGFGKSTTVGYGYFDIDYQESNCEEPMELLMRGFNVAAEFSLFGPVRIFLDTNRISTGVVQPVWQYYDTVAVGDGNFFPAINRNSFYLMLEIPRTKTRCISLGPVNLVAEVHSWPPPRGTVYRCLEEVKFRSIDSTGEFERLGLTVTLQNTLRATFYDKGALDVQLDARPAADQHFAIQAKVTSSADTVVETGWHFYTKGKLLKLREPGDTLSQYGHYAGNDSLQPGHTAVIDIKGRMEKPGREYVAVIVGSRTGRANFFGDEKLIPISLPAAGFEIETLEPWRVKAGEDVEVVLRGKSIAEPLKLEVAGGGVVVLSIERVSEHEARARLRVEAGAGTTDRDITISSKGRGYTIADGLRILNRQPTVQSVSPAKVKAGQKFALSLKGENFPATSFVSLGSEVRIEELRKVSDSELHLTARAAADLDTPLDVMFASSLGSVRLDDAVQVENDFGPRDLLAHWYITAIVPLACIAALMRWKMRRGNNGVHGNK